MDHQQGGGEDGEVSVCLPSREIFLLLYGEADSFSDDVDEEEQDENDPGSEGGVFLVMAPALDLKGQIKPVVGILLLRSTEIPKQGSAVD